MPCNRRALLHLGVGSVAMGLLSTMPLAHASTKPTIKAIAFDAFTTFDPQPIVALAEKLFPNKGAALGNTWRTRQFEYTWLRSVSQRYADFWKVTEDALVFAANMLRLDLSADKRAQLMAAYLDLKAYPDVRPALESLKHAGIRLAFLSNMTLPMLDAATKNAGLEGMLEFALSTDKVHTYKPDPRAYQLGIDAFGLPRQEILFAAFGGWDAAGAKWFGYPTFWVNRLHLPVEELDAVPDAMGDSLTDVAHFVRSQ
jgi:2-haloacid dehalogenase